MDMSGIWWEKADDAELVTKGISNNDTNVWHKGVPDAVSKDIWQLWRWKQPWIILRVRKSGSFGKTPYYIYFSSSDGSRIYKQIINEEFIAVRLGKGLIVFGIVSAYLGPELKLGRVIEQWSDVFYKNDRNGKYYPLKKKVSNESDYIDFILGSRVLWIWS